MIGKEDDDDKKTVQGKEENDVRQMQFFAHVNNKAMNCYDIVFQTPNGNSKLMRMGIMIFFFLPKVDRLGIRTV